MKYSHQDQILPLLQMQGELPDSCPVTVELTEEFVYLFVGQRDWQWDRETGRLVGAGLCHTDGTRSGMRAGLGVAGAIPVNLPFCLGNPSEKAEGTETTENNALCASDDAKDSVPPTGVRSRGFTILWKPGEPFDCLAAPFPEDRPENQ
jgi:hypothetical protein